MRGPGERVRHILEARKRTPQARAVHITFGLAPTPGRYVGVGATEEEGALFQDKMGCLTTALRKQLDESERLDETIREVLGAMGYGA